MPNYVDTFIQEATTQIRESTTAQESKTKLIGLDDIVVVLVLQGLLTLCLPILREWIALPITALNLKEMELRTRIKKKLMDYARNKNLDYESAEKAAHAITDKLSADTIKKLLQSGKTKI